MNLGSSGWCPDSNSPTIWGLWYRAPDLWNLPYLKGSKYHPSQYIEPEVTTYQPLQAYREREHTVPAT